MAYGNLNKTTDEINTLLGKIKDTDLELNPKSQNPVANAAVTAKLTELESQIGDIGTLLDTLNGEVI